MNQTFDLAEAVFFRTELGWMGIGYQANRIRKLTFGHETRVQAESEFGSTEFSKAKSNSESQMWVDQLTAYAQGLTCDFSGLCLDLNGKTDFQLAVIEACRQIPRGETRSYLELAKIAGSTGAARAVGSVMSQNRIPLIIPCHRVISSSGLGGFSAANGVTSKRRLLELEGYLQSSPTQKQLAI